MDSADIFVGFEISTQQVKVIAVDDSLTVTYEDSVKFDTELPEFNTTGGVHIHEDRLTVTASPLMWAKALDIVLLRMKSSGFTFNRVRAVSGTGQQHGSVYWTTGARSILANLDITKTLAEQLLDCFSINESPIWMDASTNEQCRRVEAKLGGSMRLTEITGCRAYHRITGNQIAKIFETQRDSYNNTERISLVSSFAASLFLGGYAPIDESDGSGMNLMDLKARDWSQDCINAFAVVGLKDKLGDIVPSCRCIGNLSKYMVERYGFPADCRLIAFTGDNPASMAGMRPNRGDIVVSLGTSDTLLLWLDEPKVSLEGLVLVNPLDTNAYMGMLCFKNGSLTREKVKDDCVRQTQKQVWRVSGPIDSWVIFEKLLSSTEPGNNGFIGIYFDVPEITPNAVGIYRFKENDEQMGSFEPEVEVRALIEGQFMAKRVHAENLGFHLGSAGKLLTTGGASSNSAILQILADVFNTSVYIQTVANSACLGSAYRAKHGLLCEREKRAVVFNDVVKTASIEITCAATPNPQAAKVYDSLVERYRILERKIVTNKTTL